MTACNLLLNHVHFRGKKRKFKKRPETRVGDAFLPSAGTDNTSDHCRGTECKVSKIDEVNRKRESQYRISSER